MAHWQHQSSYVGHRQWRKCCESHKSIERLLSEEAAADASTNSADEMGDLEDEQPDSGEDDLDEETSDEDLEDDSCLHLR